MGDKTLISWTDATWNPIQARNIATARPAGIASMSLRPAAIAMPSG